MKKSNKSLLLGLLAATMAFTACDYEDDYAPGSGENTNKNAVVFPYEAGAEETVEFDATEWTFTATRAEAGDAVEIPLVVLENTDDCFEVPASIKFEAGQTNALVTIGLKEDMPYNKACRLDLTVPESYRLNYQDGSHMGVVITKSTYIPMSGKAIYREDCMTTFWNTGNPVYEVDIEYDFVNVGRYRLVNPYGEAYPYNEPGDYDADGKYYLEIDATDPDFVYVIGGEQGLNWGYGVVSITSMVDYYMKGGNSLSAVKTAKPEIFGKLEDGMITMPAGSMVIRMDGANSGNWAPSNTSGQFAIVLPEAEEGEE